MKELKLEDILKNTSELKEKKVGYVAIIGRPNTGKSTFVNTLIGKKISITTNVPQTTRKKVLGIYNDEDSQIIFFDTPGIHKSEKLFNKEINKEAIRTLKDSSVILYFVDSSRPGGEEEKYIKEILSQVKKVVLKIYTKIDLEPKINIPKNDNIFKISSVNKTGFKKLISEIKKYLDFQTIFFPEEYYTKQDLFFRISEIIREKVFLHTKQELPHSVYIKVEEIDEKEDVINILAYIYTETESQKYILIGNKGALLSKIGKEARLDLQDIFEKKIYLKLRIKTNKKWKKDEKQIKKIFE